MRAAALILKVPPEERWLALSGACLWDERRIFTEITASRSLLFGSVFGLKFDSFSQREEKVRLDGPEARQKNGNVLCCVCLFVCLFVWPAADCGSVVGRWEELQPDAGRWWMSAGFKVRSCRGTSLSLMWKKKREKTREYWVFSVRDEECEEDRQGGNSSTACLSACLSVCWIIKTYSREVKVWSVW